MRTFTKEELNDIIEKHVKWLINVECGERADFSGADLRGANLAGVNLSKANLYGANLAGVNLYVANLSGANLSRAILRGANLLGAKFRGASFSEADLRWVENGPYVPMACPDTGAFFGWKKAGGYIVKLWIPEDARRSSATGRKCRCDKAVVVAIEEIDGRPTIVDQVVSNYDPDFIYKVHCTVRVDDFCEDRFVECGSGIHFFINRQEAVAY